MALQRVSLKKEAVTATVRNKLRAIDNEPPEGPMSITRFIVSMFSLMFGLAVIYASIFYAPAFYDFNRALGLSTEDGKLPIIKEEKEHALSAYTDMFKLRRGYIRKGQALEVKYVLSPGTKMTLSIQHCKAPVVIEAFYCMNTQGEQSTVKNELRGTKAFIMRQPGFYYFDEEVTNLDGTATTKPFTVIWKRKV